MAVRAMTPTERLRRIFAFREEVTALREEGVVASEDPTLAAIAARHDVLLAAAARDERIDLSREEARLSAGMQLATLLGATALSIAWAMFVSSMWDGLGDTARMFLIWVPPALMVVATAMAARREATGYIANILASVGAIALIVAILATIDLYELEPSRHAILLVAAYALLQAYHHRLVIPLLIGGTALGAWVWSLAAIFRGGQWQEAFEVAEPAVVAGALALAIGTTRTGDPAEFRIVWRLGGVIAIVWSLLVLGVAGDASWFGPGNLVEGFYQVLAAVVFVAMAWQGLRTDDPILARGGGVALLLFLLFRMFDWFWDAIPDWLFFLLMGALAFGVLLVLRRLRRRHRALG
jgi:hypothetical protein